MLMLYVDQISQTVKAFNAALDLKFRTPEAIINSLIVLKLQLRASVCYQRFMINVESHHLWNKWPINLM